MAEEIDVENGRNSNFEGLVTLTLTFDPAIRHTVLYVLQASTEKTDAAAYHFCICIIDFVRDP